MNNGYDRSPPDYKIAMIQRNDIDNDTTGFEAAPCFPLNLR